MAIQMGRAVPELLFIWGTDRDAAITEYGTQAQIRGSTDIYKLLGTGEPFHRLQITRHLLRQKRRPDLSPYRYLVNMITEPEQNDHVLENLRKLLRHAGGRVINRPEAVLRSTRDHVARRLAGIPGLHVPRVFRIQPAKAEQSIQLLARAGLEFPVILRRAGTHTGQTVSLVERLDDIRPMIDGDGDHFATEFVDFRSSDGLYRKYRVMFIGDRTIFRHKMISDQWNVHGRDRTRVMSGRPDLLAEEASMMATPEGAFAPEVKMVLRAIRERMDLDFFGVDFAIREHGEVLLFEANATMNIYSPLPGPQFDYLQGVLPPARAAFRKLVGMERPQDMEFA